MLRRSDVVAARSAERISNGARVLSRPPRRPGPGPGPGASARPAHVPERVDVPAPSVQLPADAPAAVREPASAALVPSSRAAVARRRRVLLVLAGAFVLGTVAAAFVGSAGLVLAVPAALGLLGYLVVLQTSAARVRRARNAAIRAESRRVALERWSRVRVTEPAAPAPAPAPAPQPPMSPRETRPAAQEVRPAAASVVVEPVETPADPAPAREAIASAASPAAAAAAAPSTPVRPAARPRRRPAAGEPWMPVPVPIPTYLTAPRAPYPSTPRRVVNPPAAKREATPAPARTGRPMADLPQRRAVGG